MGIKPIWLFEIDTVMKLAPLEDKRIQLKDASHQSGAIREIRPASVPCLSENTKYQFIFS